MTGRGPAPAHLAGLPDPLEVVPLTTAPDTTVVPPGSKSITNRALVCAALATGESTLRGALISDDTEAMLECLASLGIRCRITAADEGDTGARRAAEGPGPGPGPSVVVEGAGGPPPAEGAVLDARLSGTTSRFIAPVCVLGRTTVVLDGAPRLRERPMGDLLGALRSLGAEVVDLGEPDHLPVQLDGGRHGVQGGSVAVRADASSQFLSGLLLAAPAMPRGLEVEVTTELVSAPYVAMTISVMESFGATVDASEDLRRIQVEPGGYEGRDLLVEPDASAASYFLAAAAATGGRLRIDGLGTSSQQGDVAFAEVLERMGAQVRRGSDWIEVTGPAQLRGVEVDMADISDTAQTLAAIAPLASGPTRITGVGFIRGKETDRIGAVVTELRRLGVDATEEPDGLTVRPGPVSPATVQTYDDHRMAMSFAVLGLAVPGVSVADPGCVAKTFPGFWDALSALR